MASHRRSCNPPPRPRRPAPAASSASSSSPHSPPSYRDDAGGVAALGIDLPFRQARAKGPPSPTWAARDREGLRHALGVLARRCTGRLMLGGHSYGGRQASMLLADTPGL